MDRTGTQPESRQGSGPSPTTVTEGTEVDPARILLAGDTHGDAEWWRHLVEAAGRHHCDGIFQLGDFGVWPGAAGQRYLDSVASLLERAGTRAWFVDGNHEDFPQLHGYPLTDGGWREVRPRLHHAPRGHRWSWRGTRFLACGGAGSVDRRFRTEGRSWWPEETITDGDVDRAVADGRADVMLTHDTPVRLWPVSPPGSRWLATVLGADVLASCRASQERLQHVVDTVRPRLLAHGHWHLWRDTRAVHPDGAEFRVVGLDRDGGVRSAAVLELPSLEVTAVD